MKEIKASEGWLKRTDGLGHLTPSEWCCDFQRYLLGCSESYHQLCIFFSLATGVTHEKKNEARKDFIQRYQGHICQAQNHADLGTMFQAELKTFNSQKCCLPQVRQFSSSKKGSSARFRKKGQKTSCTSISSWKTTCQWVKWTRIQAHMDWISLKILLGSKFQGQSGGGVKFLGKYNVFFCRPQAV